MSPRFDEDLSSWERGEISLTDLAARHPDQDVFGLAGLYMCLATAGREPTPDPEEGWDAVRVGLLEPSVRRFHPGRRWRARSIMAAAALVILTTGIALAVEPVRRGVTSFLREAAGVVAGGGFVEPLSELLAPLRADPLRAMGYEDHVVEWLPSVTGGDSATCAIVGVPAHGRAHISPDCSAGSYHPAPNFHGGDSFTYAAIDGDRLSGPATVEVVLEPINDAPSAVDDHTTTSEDTVVPVDVLDNDDDVDLAALGPSGTTPTEAGPGSARTLTPVAIEGAKGRVVVTPDGLVYRPPPDFNGTDEFRYTIEDQHGASDSAAVRVRVLPVNDPPVVPHVSASGNEDASLDWEPSATDVDGDTLTCSIIDPPAHGKATVGVDCAGGTYIPDEHFNGTDAMSFTVTDGASSITAVAVLRVGAVNDPPLVEDVSASGDEDATIEWDPAATDVDGDELTCSIVDRPTHGQATVRADCSGAAYVPDENYNGDDVFTYAATDGAVRSLKPASVKVTIQPVNDAPVAGPDVVTTSQGVAVTIAMLSNDADPDGDALSITTIGPPTAGSVNLNADGTLTYVPWADVTGSDRFVYVIADPTGATAIGSVTVTVVPPPPPPPPPPSIQILPGPRPPDGSSPGADLRLQEREAPPTER
jgi:large repetitive protein